MPDGSAATANGRRRPLAFGYRIYRQRDTDVRDEARPAVAKRLLDGAGRGYFSIVTRPTRFELLW